MKTSRMCFIIFTFFSLVVFQANGRFVYAIEDKHEGHRHGSHEEEHVEDNHNERGDNHAEHGHEDKHESHEEHSEDEHEGHEEEGALQLDDEARSMIQLKLAKAEKRSLGGHLKVYGKIAKDTENYTYITFNGEGKVASIEAELGSIVDKGDTLITIKTGDGALKEIQSKIHGAVLSIFVKPGDTVDSLTTLLSIIDVDTLRATIDIYERDLRLIEVGQKVILTTAAYSNNKFYGKVVYISPQVDEHTQAIKVRVDVDNPDHLLRLGMFVSGELIYASGKEVLSVPLDAVQQLNGEDIVFVEGEGNNLSLREVVLGRSVNDYVEIVKGLNEGEMVVTKGSFYLKSEIAKEAFGDGHNH